MSTTTFTQVNAYVATNILGNITGNGQKLNETHAYPNPEPKKFPCSMVIAKAGAEGIFDTMDNETKMQFVIRTMLLDENNKATYDKMLSVLDAVLAELRKNNHCTLGGLVQKFEVNGDITLFRTKQASYNIVGFDIEVVASVLNDTVS